MITGLERVNSRRAWFVPGLVVWGLPAVSTVAYALTEDVNGISSVLYGETALGEAAQEVNFGDLIDVRGNNLPAEIKSPRIVPRSRNQYPAFISELESNESFRIARDPDAPSPVTVDLMIVEMGE